MRSRVSVFAALVVLGLASLLWSARADQEAQLPAELEPFARLKLPTVAGRTFVRYVPAGYSWSRGNERTFHFESVTGWITSGSGTRLTLLSTKLATTTHDRARDLERTRRMRARGETIENPSPGDMEEVDFDALCEDFLRKKPANHANMRPGGRLSTEGEILLFAYWEWQRGRCATSKKLIGLTGESRPDKRRATAIDDLAVNQRYQVMLSAHGGAPRTEILARSQTIAALFSDSPLRGKDIVQEAGHYASLVAEDSLWSGRTASDLATASVESRVAFWTHKLRDVDGGQMLQPGGPSIYATSMRPHPAKELERIGWAAIPQLIEHMTDERPTRTLGYHRDFEPASYELVEIGSACSAIFESITGETISCTREGNTWSGWFSLEDRQKKARAFWEEWGTKPAAHFESLLASDLWGQRERGARGLLNLDAERYATRCFEQADKLSGPARASLLRTIVGCLGRDHAKELEPCLDDGDPLVALDAAIALCERCASDRGASWVVERLRDPPEEILGTSSLARALLAVARHPKPFAADAIVALINDESSPVQGDVLRAVAWSPTPTFAAALASLLETASKAAPETAKARSRQAAAVALATMLARPSVVEDAEIRELLLWWHANKTTMDWAALRSRADEKRPRHEMNGDDD